MTEDLWTPIENGLPEPGTYLTRVDRAGDIIEVKKKLMIHGDNYQWFGGCRPFCENDIVIAWRNI